MSTVVGILAAFVGGFAFGTVREKYRRMILVAQAREEFDQLMLEITSYADAKHVNPLDGGVDMADPQNWGAA